MVCNCGNKEELTQETYDVVGSICETGDFLGKNRSLKIQAGDYLAIAQAGAYGFSMASNYNSRALPAEVLIEKGQTRLIRERQTFAQMYDAEIKCL